MKTLYAILFCALTLVLSGASPKIAIFDEPGFPNASSRNAEFYRKTLNGTILRLNELSKLKNFDTIIFPHGGYMPAAAEKAVYHLMRRGGTVIVCGDIQEPLPKIKRPRKRNAETLLFEEKNGLAHGGPLSLVDGKWIVAPTGVIYEMNRAASWYEFLSLSGWPNYAQSYAPYYMRNFDKKVTLNPVFKKSGLPAQILPPKKKLMLARLRPVGETGDNVLDVFHPLYLFAAPSGNRYPPYTMAGKSEEDRAADGFIYRKFRPDMFGATLVVMGKTGRMLLDSPQGAETIRKIVKLANSPLPGTLPHAFIKRVHAMEKAIQDYNILNADLMSALKNLAVKNFPAGKHHPQLVRLKSLRTEFSRLNNLFDSIMMLKERKTVIPAAKLNELASAIKTASARRQAELAPLKKFISPVDGGDAAHPYKKFILMTSNFGPWHVDDDANWKKLQSLGITISRISAINWKDMEILNKRYGFLSTYTAIPMHRSHPDKKLVNSGVFNPASGTVKKVRARVWQKSAPDIDSAVIHNLKNAEKSSGIGVVIHGDERDFQWSLWGEYMQGLFRNYLTRKYQNIQNLNKEYNANYTAFDKIVLPLKRPVTQTEHALWEDWTRYREIYRQENELFRWVKMIKKYAPSKMQWLYGSYHLQDKHPANGINYYETGKLLDPATFESSTNPRKEVMTYDIATFGKKHVNPEWAGFYFPAGSRLANMNRMREFLWNEANCGTIAWHTFMGGVQTRSRWTSTPLITPNGNIQPEGIAMRDTVRELNAARKIFLDGKRVEPEVRFIYSPTTRRHTSWPGFENDRSYQCVTGLNEAFKALHIPARGIDEQAVWENKLPSRCRFLIVPSVEYMNRKLLAALKKFMNDGGIVIATADSGKFDEYGHKHDSLLEIAGVRPVKTIDADFSMFMPDKLEILFPKETSVLLRYADNSIAATTTKVGKGKLVICGYPIGREFNNTGKGLNSLQKLAAALNISRPFICNDTNLVIRPWELNGELYLACYYIQRDTVPVAKGDFPLRSAPLLIPFSINISGNVTAKDMLTGTRLKTETSGSDTIVSGLIGNPGGCIIKLSKSTLPRRVVKSTQAVKTSSVAAVEKIYSFPAKDRFFAEWRKIKIGKYTLTIAAENDGAWQGKVFATLSDGKRTLKRLCTPHSTVKFRFDENTVIFRCSNAQSVMPVNIEGTFTEVKNKNPKGCKLEINESRIVLQNSAIYVAILPEFGGRIAELRAVHDSPNQLLLHEKTIAEGMGKSYRDFGGIEYNPGRYQGAGWQIPFKAEVIKNTPAEVIVRLNRSGKYSIFRGGEISYEIFYRLTANSPFLETSVRLYNEMESAALIAFRTHPIFLAGGDCNVHDVFCWQSPKGPENVTYRPGASAYLPNAGNFFAYIDSKAAEGVLQTFEAKQLPKLYCWQGREAYNAELHFLPQNTQPGKFALFKFNTAVVAGLKKIDAVSDAFAIAWDSAAPGADILGLAKCRKNFRLSLESNGKVLASKKLNAALLPNKLVRISADTGKLVVGNYTLRLNDGKVDYSYSFTVKPQRTESNRSKTLAALLKEYQRNPSAALRRKIFVLSGESAD